MHSLEGEGKGEDDAHYVDVTTQSERLKICGMLWALVEMLLIDRSPSLSPAAKLWLQQYFYIPAEGADWNDVLFAVLQGQV